MYAYDFCLTKVSDEALVKAGKKIVDNNKRDWSTKTYNRPLYEIPHKVDARLILRRRRERLRQIRLHGVVRRQHPEQGLGLVYHVSPLGVCILGHGPREDFVGPILACCCGGVTVWDSQALAAVWSDKNGWHVWM